MGILRLQITEVTATVTCPTGTGQRGLVQRRRNAGYSSKESEWRHHSCRMTVPAEARAGGRRLFDRHPTSRKFAPHFLPLSSAASASSVAYDARPKFDLSQEPGISAISRTEKSCEARRPACRMASRARSKRSAPTISSAP